MFVNLPAVTAPGQNVRDALIPIAQTICSGVRFNTRPAATGAAKALKRGVMPAVFTHTGPPDFAQDAFQFRRQ